jgi:hypothetical protein
MFITFFCVCVCVWTAECVFFGTSILDFSLAAFSQVESSSSQFFPATCHPHFVLANVTCLGAAEVLLCTALTPNWKRHCSLEKSR